jgi:hypothetical protein
MEDDRAVTDMGGDLRESLNLSDLEQRNVLEVQLPSKLALAMFQCELKGTGSLANH